jgi:hypothetical protein
MLGKYIDFRLFFISLAAGIFLVYLYQPKSTIIYVYPTPDNFNNLTLKDKANNCFRFNAKEVGCPTDEKQIHTIPIQESKS